MTQREMNEQARLAYEEAEDQMRFAFFQLAARKGESMPMGPPVEGGLYQAQALRDKFSEEQAKAQAQPYRRGDLYTRAFLEAKKESVLARTKQLTEELEKIEKATPNSDPLEPGVAPHPMTYVTKNDYYF